MCTRTYERVWSEEKQMFFFYNKNTGSSSWDKPKILGTNELPETPREESPGKEPGSRRRSVLHVWTDEEAALALQAMWRKRQARREILKMCTRTYERYGPRKSRCFSSTTRTQVNQAGTNQR